MDWKITILWLVLMLVLAFLEAATTQLVTIWFALGALAAMLASILHAPLQETQERASVRARGS